MRVELYLPWTLLRSRRFPENRAPVYFGVSLPCEPPSMLSLVDEMQEMWASPQHKLTAYEAYLEERIALRRALHATALSRAPTPYPDSTACHLRCEDSTPDDSASTSSRLEAKYLSQLSTLEGSSPSRVGSKRGLDEDDEMSGAAARVGQRTR